MLNEEISMRWIHWQLKDADYKLENLPEYSAAWWYLVDMMQERQKSTEEQ